MKVWVPSVSPRRESGVGNQMTERGSIPHLTIKFKGNPYKVPLDIG